MGTISDKLTYLNTTKSQLKDMINYGLPSEQQITNSTTFRNYVSSIFNAFLEALRTPDTLFTNLPKKSGSGSVISLNDTANAPMRIELGASELTQSGTPTPSSPQDIHTISGSNKVVGSNSDNTISQEAEIDLSSKNLFTTRNNFSMITGYANYNVLDTNSLDAISTGNSYGYRYVRFQLNGLKVGTTYYVSAKFENSDKTTTSPLYIRNSADSSNLFANDGYTSGTKVSFTATETTALIRFYASGSTAKINTCTWYDIMVSQDQNADFMPYYEPIEYCKIGNYEDKFIRSNDGTWQLKKNIGKVVLDGNITLNYNGTAGQFYNTNQNNIPNYQARTPMLCNYLQYSSTTWVKNCFGITSTNVFWLYIENGPTTLADLQTWLNTNNLEVYYPLATPTYTQITGTLAEQLENIYKNMLSQKGQTNISQVNNDLSFNLSVSAIEEL